nr:RNA polymerase sigma-70 factor [Chryseosolibacter indicus]
MHEIAVGNRSAFNQLFLRYYSRLCSFASFIVRDEAASEEVVSEVLLNIWKNRKTIHIQSSVRAYLFTCVRNEALRAVKQKNMILIKPEDDALQTLSDDYDPHESLEFQELENNVHFVIGSLPEKCKQFFMLSRFDGLKYSEIAQLYNVSEKTVENQIIKALKILRERILETPKRHFTSP